MTATIDADFLAAARKPTAEWLESCFGAGTLWRPSPESLPERLEHAETRAFLTEVGIPAVEIDCVGYNSTDLPERGMWEADADELFATREPDDYSPPSRWAYCVGSFSDWHLMVDATSGAVEIYNSEGYEDGRGHDGRAADSLPQVIGALGLLARFEERICEGDAKAALDEFTALLEQLGQGPGESDLWVGLLENLRDEYEDLDED